ncbi:VOC family protein [Streptomyces cinnabarinus]|uniref:VOC family protein n=1 Tax=Streptomyces cinnabarinus TaxID=67287 RepID=A0ABY7KLL9_9ACTN|nr:VOC family protein [Streptomyces cinnabarinus]WAZ25455.1 VOC family protein [Streptomyces cinnabarinus]
MASRLNPYLTFAGDARQAMEFYQQVFGGTLNLNSYGDFGQPDPAMADKIMHGLLETPNGFTLMGADNPEGAGKQGEHKYAVSLSGDDDTELRGYWEKLSEGGQVSVPLDKQMWGDVFGMCTDRFGVPWMVNISEKTG